MGKIQFKLGLPDKLFQNDVILETRIFGQVGPIDSVARGKTSYLKLPYSNSIYVMASSSHLSKDSLRVDAICCLAMSLFLRSW